MGDKTCDLLINGQDVIVSVDRLEPTYTLADEDDSHTLKAHLLRGFRSRQIILLPPKNNQRNFQGFQRQRDRSLEQDHGLDSPIASKKDFHEPNSFIFYFLFKSNKDSFQMYRAI